MPLVYADTSVLFAYFHPKDNFAIAVTQAVRKQPVDFFYWPFMRYDIQILEGTKYPA